MYTSETIAEISIWFFIILVLYFLISYNWKRRWLYFHASKLPGPIAFPLVGSFHILAKGYEDAYNCLTKLCNTYQPVFKVWIGTKLYMFSARPKDLEMLLTRSLQKIDLLETVHDYRNESLLTSPVEKWTVHRRLINQSFSANLIYSFMDEFVKHANRLADMLEEHCGFENDFLFVTWRALFDSSCETLGDVDSDLVKGQDDILTAILRIENIVVERFHNPIFHLDFFWKLSSLNREGQTIITKIRDFFHQAMDIKKNSSNRNEFHAKNDKGITLRQKRFVNNLVKLVEQNKLTEDDMIEEILFMFVASTESSAILINSVLLILGMYPDIQKKIFEEIDTVCEKDSEKVTLQDVKQMQYLDRVIKETLRLLPLAPFIGRQTDEDIHLDDSYIFPAGSKIVIPIVFIHRRPDLFPNPLKFDPDRFLPDEAEKRHRHAYLPFSLGPRNCIGMNYAKLQQKIILLTILKRYKVTKCVDYKKIEDIDVTFLVVAKAKKGYKIVLEKRNI